MLASLGISSRIYIGFGVVLALLTALAVFTYTSMTTLIDTFKNYRDTARQTLYMAEKVEALGEARLARVNFAMTRDPKYVDVVNKGLDVILKAASEARAIFADADEASLAEAAAATGALADDYRAAFRRQVAAAERGVTLAKEFQDHGFELYTALERIMSQARDAIDSEFGRSQADSEVLIWASELTIQFFRSRMRATLYQFTADQAELDGALQRIGLMEAAHQKLLAAASHRADVRALVEGLRPMLDRFKAELDEMRTVLGAEAEASTYLTTDIGPRLTRAFADLQAEVVRRQNELGPQAAAKMEETQSVATTIGVSALLVGVVLAFVIGRWIAGAVNAMASSMSKMAAGDLEIAVTGDEHKHELGAMARALKIFQTNAKEKLRLDAEARAAAERDAAAAKERAALQEAVAGVVEKAAAGDFVKRVEARFKDDGLNQFAHMMNALLDTVGKGIEETAKVMASLARGDLDVSMRGDFKGGFADLQNNVNGTVRKLRDTVLEIQRVADGMKTATGEIAQGAGDLSSRAENQAASLEEIAATMEEMSATVKTNAENALSASNLSADARSRADKGGAIVSEAVKAMSAIEEGSGKIADIVSVIDGFAFQTNLLALNAAVEAARAGEAGKGFAVVASEVRTLAQRSAEAARDIKNLIQESSHQVTDGVRLVEETGAALREIVDAIRKVSETITEISEASREQSSGVDEITSAITSMDEITQQNSALAEESASAAKGLAEQARHLEKLMSFFTVSTGGGRSADAEAWDADAAADRGASKARAGKAAA